MVKASPPTLTIGSGNDVTYLTPAINGFNVVMDGAPDDPAGLFLNDGTANTLNNITVGGIISSVPPDQVPVGGLTNPGAGVVTLGSGASLTLTHGFDVLVNGNLTLGSPNVGSVTLYGSSEADNGGSFTGIGAFTLNGTLTAEHASGVTLNAATVTGHGTLEMESGGVVAMTNLIAGLHADVGKGSSLELFSPNNGGTINEANGGIVFVTNLAAPATSEVFHRATGTADLLSASGAQVAQLKFDPGERIYAYPTDGPGGGSNTGIAALFTTSPNSFPGDPRLPVTFTH